MVYATGTLQQPSAPVTIEIPKGRRYKYQMDHHTGRIRLDHYSYTSMGYPADRSLIEDSLGEYGDPLDALVPIPEPDCSVSSSPVLCVPATDTRWDHITDIVDVPSFELEAKPESVDGPVI